MRFHRLLLLIPGIGLALVFCLCSAIVSVPSASQPNTAIFDSSRAFELLKKQCDFGPRPVGSIAHAKTRDFLVTELRRSADSVTVQKFTRVLNGRSCELANIVGRFGKGGAPGILLCAHWDTRPVADKDPDSAMRSRPILGANDGASGVAALLELARMFRRRPPSVPVTIVLFDGEDFGLKPQEMLLGSKHFASTLRGKPFRYGILLDMVGDKDLQIYREAYSQKYAAPVVDKVWRAAAASGAASIFRDTVKHAIVDDHLPLLEAGVPCIDVIDFDYPYWHTLADTPDKCSPASLGAVGRTVARVVYAELP